MAFANLTGLQKSMERTKWWRRILPSDEPADKAMGIAVGESLPFGASFCRQAVFRLMASTASGAMRFVMIRYLRRADS